MLFDKNKYYKYIVDVQSSIIVFYAIAVTILGIIGVVLLKGKGLLMGIIAGIFFAWCYTHHTKIKLEEMRMKLDEYQLLVNISESLSNIK